VDHLHRALPFLRIGRELRQRECFRVAANRGQRRHQLVRHIGEQLPPRAIGLHQLRLPRRQVGGHAIERGRDRGDFIAANLGRARGEIAFTKTAGRLLDRAQPRLRRPEDHERRHRGAADEQQERADHQRRAERFGDPARARERRHPHHGHDLIVVLDRYDYGSAAWLSERRARQHLLAVRWTRRWRSTAISGAGTTTPHRSRKSNAARDGRAWRRHRAAIRKNDHRGSMQLADTLLRVAAEIELRIARQRRLELRRHQLREVTPHAFGHAAFALARHPHKEQPLQHQRDGEEENEAEADAPVEAAREGSGGHQRSAHL